MPQRSSVSQPAQSAAGTCVARDTLHRRNQFKTKLADLNSRYSGVDHALVFDAKDWGNPTAIRAAAAIVIDDSTIVIYRYFTRATGDFGWN